MSHSQSSGGCGLCPKGWRALLSRKLGQCQSCMRWSFGISMLLMMGSLAVTVVVKTPFILQLTMLVLAASSLTLWLTHVFKFSRNFTASNANVEEIQISSKGVSSISKQMNRREILQLTARSALAALVLSTPFSVGTRVVANHNGCTCLGQDWTVCTCGTCCDSWAKDAKDLLDWHYPGVGMFCGSLCHTVTTGIRPCECL